MSLAAEFLRPHLALIALEISRLGGVIAVSPIPWSNAPNQVRVGLILAMLLVVHDQGASPVTELPSAGWSALHITSEVLVGVALGMVVRLSISAAEICGNAIATPMGFGAAQAFDPTTGSSDSSLTRVFRTLALLLALAIGMHRILIGALLSSFVSLPVGTVAHLEATFPIFLEFSSHMLEVGVRLALPLLSVLLMVNAALGFVARAAPTMQIFNVGFAVLLSTGAIVLIISLPEMGRELVTVMNRNVRYFGRLLAEMSPP